MVAPFISFTAKFGLVLVLTVQKMKFSIKETADSVTFTKEIFNGRHHFPLSVSLEVSVQQKKHRFLFERSACFNVTMSRNFERFQHFNLQTYFQENGKLFQKNGV